MVSYSIIKNIYKYLVRIIEAKVRWNMPSMYAKMSIIYTLKIYMLSWLQPISLAYRNNSLFTFYDKNYESRFLYHIMSMALYILYIIKINALLKYKFLNEIIKYKILINFKKLFLNLFSHTYYIHRFYTDIGTWFFTLKFSVFWTYIALSKNTRTQEICFSKTLVFP